jgi:hypothetical protein
MKPSVSFVARSDEDKTWGVLGDVDHLLSCTEARPFCPRSPPSPSPGGGGGGGGGAERAHTRLDVRRWMTLPRSHGSRS